MGFSAELRRLDRARSGARGRRWASRAIRLALLGFLALAVFHRAAWALPGLSDLDGRPLRAALAVLAVALGAWAAARIASLVATFDARRLARRLDERHRLYDLADTALSLDRRGAVTPIDHLVVARATHAARTADAAIAEPRAGRRSARVPVLLGVLAIVVLLLPGVLGFGGRDGAGRGTDVGPGRTPPDEASRDEKGLTPEDADRWLDEHAKLRLDVPDLAHTLRWRAALDTDAPFPAPYRARLGFRVDRGAVLGPTGEVAVPKGTTAHEKALVDAASIPALKQALKPGKHLVVAALTPAEGPWTRVLESPPIEVIVEPPSSSPQPQPQPQPPPPQPPPPVPVAPPPPTPPPPPPPTAFRDEVVTPLSREGPRVRKDEALVAVPDDDAGMTPPKTVPLARALTEFGSVVERAVASERVLPADREFLRRYLDALRRAAGVSR